MRFFFTALSISLCAFERVSLEGLASNALTAALMARLVATFRSLRTAACFTRLIADLMIGTRFHSYVRYTFYYNLRGDYRGKRCICKASMANDYLLTYIYRL